MITKQQIKYILSLQQKKNRNDLNLYVIEGLKLVLEAIRQIPHDIEFICLATKNQDLIKEEISGTKIQVLECTSDVFKKISSLTTPQEILAVIKKPKRKVFSPDSLHDLCLALDGIRDPGNMGTIIRLADWFGIRQVVCSPDTVDCYSPKVVQATMGAILRVDLIYTELSQWLDDIKRKRDVTIYCTASNGDNLYTSTFKKPAIIIMGNEANGISEGLIQLTDKTICIPNYSNFPDKTESLNVSVATGVICAEFRRQTSM